MISDRVQRLSAPVHPVRRDPVIDPPRVLVSHNTTHD
jgi:hypothetical protein